MKRHGSVMYPIGTEDLLFMLEREASVDLYADLDSATGEVWGETEFLPGDKPYVRILRRLAENDSYSNPLRTTITHEFGHVHYHGFMFAASQSSGNLFGLGEHATKTCKREHMERPKVSDWMEWQANYCSGALLIPQSAARRVVTDFLRANDIAAAKHGPASPAGLRLTSSVAKTFSVSEAAARVRLSQLGYLNEGSENQKILLT
ncbi:MAG: ImmA/IrrE family metallo-endopeptidase [Acidobacteriia bacterium]|nr:ImmA/IrrE family metallo-endopeptidase [Terriglobia bacterium]